MPSAALPSASPARLGSCSPQPRAGRRGGRSRRAAALARARLGQAGCRGVRRDHHRAVASGGLLLAGRFMHARSFLKEEMDVKLRVNGMRCTFWSLRILAGLNIFAIIMAFV